MPRSTARRATTPVLELRGVKKRYAGTTVLNGIDLSLDEKLPQRFVDCGLDPERHTRIFSRQPVDDVRHERRGESRIAANLDLARSWIGEKFDGAQPVAQVVENSVPAVQQGAATGGRLIVHSSSFEARTCVRAPQDDAEASSKELVARVQISPHLREHVAEHLRCQHTGVGVVTRAVIAVVKLQCAGPMHRAVGERRVRGFEPDRLKGGIVGDATQHHDSA